MTPPVGAVGVIGAGAVGQSVALSLMANGWCREIAVTSGRATSAQALVADLEDMQQLLGAPTRPRATCVAQMHDCAAVVVCPRAKFTNTATADVRMAGLTANAPLIKALARALGGYAGVVVVVTNPVDVMSRLLAEVSGCQRVYGVGSNTDTARYRISLARFLDVPADSVTGHVIGEHGDNAVVCASTTRVDGQPTAVPLEQVHAELHARPHRINQGIGRARCGPAGAVLAALRATLGLMDGVIELCVNTDGHWRGTPLRFTSGHPTVCLPDLDASEADQLADADRKLHAAYATITPHHSTQGD
ncbi:NAD(P)-binding domain-containing protein [Streptomyces spectabilis]|uniref:lactate/malate family dehydrogenase n=1 Tax=Streptomyces spectabilis TaxID=68270 RepID=UPI0033C1D7A0